ncbi:hypothetical protein NDU88_006982 [Pleurodeles waltl]|uniref:SAM domain-containing protein n=2 Tax=Pleurodeles waltl TaxID=8319 RepID=A0AAV7TZ56_PLEWA|nr:hypothetical protein NDU88_006982 [Pleurodeles waltl]
MLKHSEIKKPLPKLPILKMDTAAIKWGAREYSLMEFVGKFETSFPVIIKITEGYLGKQEVDSISNSTILRVHSLYYQKRAIATSVSGKIFSLPLKLKTVQFCVGNSTHRKDRELQASFFLEDLLSQYSLPLTIVSSTDLSFKEKMSSKPKENVLDVLTVSETYEEHFLLGHPIEKETVQIETPIVIPMYMKDIKLVIAEGYLLDNTERWATVCKHYDRKVQAEGLLEHFMVEEIYLLDKNDVASKANTYDEIERIYIDIHSSEFRRQLGPMKPVPEIPPDYSTTLEEEGLPADLHALDVQKVCDCLQLLNMAEYTEAFQREQIDGQLLYELEESIMESCLGMNKLHIIKLLKFRDGWRPNLSKKVLNV